MFFLLPGVSVPELGEEVLHCLVNPVSVLTPGSSFHFLY